MCYFLLVINLVKYRVISGWIIYHTLVSYFCVTYIDLLTCMQI
ncbi:hypothetical protein ACJIZ3_019777 [Penstemon smallii]|uniref:Uncharacterized protein n=1 Tax=Penstemon smallii TaxID=265156 RepID=A0ABD3T263_9LAMI